MSFNIEKIKNVLVLMPDKHMGNLVVSLPAINALKEYFKGNTFYLLVDKAYEEIVESLEPNNIILYPRKQLDGSPLIKRLATLYKFFCKLRGSTPDLAIDLEGRSTSSIITYLSGASLRIGKSTAKRPYFYNLKVTPLREKHKVHSYREIASAVGVRNEIGIYRIRSSESKRTALKSILLKEGITIEKPIICIHPGAGKIYKQWTVEGFGEISEWLAAEGFQVVFVGGTGDLEGINNIMTLLKHHSYNLGGKLSLGELMALFEISSLYIGNDSGPMHLAGAVGIPVIALFGPADEGRWGPLSEKSIALRGEEPCEKCTGRDCQYEFKCIKTLSAKDVKVAIRSLFNTKKEHAWGKSMRS